VDVTLDSFPYNGTTTALHSLWMGVPFVTLAGATHVSRVGASILANVGLAEAIAADEADYVARAAALAMDTGRLIELRRTLRDRLRQSVIMDERGFVQRFEAACERLFDDLR
jgi:predicted O-linked N-acetylglucosamine transferase (SPINDLY family)